MKNVFLSRGLLGVIALSLCCNVAHADSPESDAVGWWTFEGNTSALNGVGTDLTAVPLTAAKLEPVETLAYEKASGITAGNVGSEAAKFNGACVLKSPNRAFRISGAQTFWLRVQFPVVPAQQVTLMARSRVRAGLYGVSLELNNGHLVGAVSGTGQQIDASVDGAPAPVLQGGQWYDIALRFEPGTSLRIDLYSPESGAKLGFWQSNAGIPKEIPATNVPGHGYLQIGAMSNGSAGSIFAVPDGTLIEAAGVWKRALTDEELGALSRALK